MKSLRRIAVILGAGLLLAAGSAFGAAPLIQWLTPTPSSVRAGTATTLHWHVDGADTVSIDHGIGTVAAQGSRAVSPAATTTYTLTATNATGMAQKSQIVVVGPNATTSGGRWVKMVSPVSGQHLTAPATVRVFAAAFNPDGVNCGVGGTDDRCADRVDFYVDDTVMAQVPGSQSEFWVFKSAFSGVGVGTHRVWARAIYHAPVEALDSEPMWITVDPVPAYAQTIDLAQDVVLGGAQDYTLAGSPGGRIRVNGNGHRILTPGAWTGKLTLRFVDFFNLGLYNDPAPGIDIATTKPVVIEDNLFETTGAVSLDIGGTATASIARNEFRSNMLMPETQQPEFGDDSSYPAIALTGSSTGAKVFQGNSVGIGWADFRNADNWTIGGAAAQGNVVIAPRGGLWAQNMTRSTIRNNFIYHVYFGGWSQGNVMEMDGSRDIVVEHNVIGGGSWPIRGFGGTLRYNLVIDAGHQWLWVTDDGAYVHHNVFAGGDSDVAGIWAIYGPQNVRIHNNTIDGSGMPGIVDPILVGDLSAVSVRANAIVNAGVTPAIQVDGTLDADYNLFHGQAGAARNYSDNRAPTHDVAGLNAQVNPKYTEPSEPWRYDWADVWSRRIRTNDILANYRTRYTPAPGSPLIDAGDPALAAGSDIGAVGSGTPAADDKFGLGDPAFADPDADDDNDGIPNGVEGPVGRNPFAKDNDVFGVARLFAMQQYRDFLGREGDASGIQFYIDAITNGSSTRSQVIENFLASPEFQNGLPQCTRLYFSFFLRIPDYSGLLFQVGAFRSGTPLEAIALNFYNSPEFTTRYGALSNDDYITLVYQNVLGRAPDPGGFAYYKNLLDTNAITRGQMMIGFSESPEFQQLSSDEVYVTSVYVGMLRRTPDTAGLGFYLNLITGGTPRNSIIANFFNAPEYRSRFLP